MDLSAAWQLSRVLKRLRPTSSTRTIRTASRWRRWRCRSAAATGGRDAGARRVAPRRLPPEGQLVLALEVPPGRLLHRRVRGDPADAGRRRRPGRPDGHGARRHRRRARRWPRRRSTCTRRSGCRTTRRSSATSPRSCRTRASAISIEAAHLVVREVPDARFVILGEGELREQLERQVREHHLEKHVLLPGFRTDVLGCIKGFDLFAMSSVTEGLGTSLLDAMACGRPIVATDGRRHSRGRRGRRDRPARAAARSPRAWPQAIVRAAHGRRHRRQRWATPASRACARASPSSGWSPRPRPSTRAWPADPTQRTLRVPLRAAESAGVHHAEVAQREVVLDRIVRIEPRAATPVISRAIAQPGLV